MPNQNNSRPRARSRAWMEVRKSRVQLPPLKGSYKTQPCASYRHNQNTTTKQLSRSPSSHQNFTSGIDPLSNTHQGHNQQTITTTRGLKTSTLKKVASFDLDPNRIHGNNGTGRKQLTSPSRCDLQSYTAADDDATDDVTTSRVCPSKLPDSGGPEDISFLKSKLGLTLPDKESVLQADSKSVRERSQVLRRRELVSLPALRRPKKAVSGPQDTFDETLEDAGYDNTGDFYGLSASTLLTPADRVKANKRRLRAEKADRRMTLAKKSRFNLLNAEFKRSKSIQDKSRAAARQNFSVLRHQMKSLETIRQEKCDTELLCDVEEMRQCERRKSKAAIEKISNWKLKMKRKRMECSRWRMPSSCNLDDDLDNDEEDGQQVSIDPSASFSRSLSVASFGRQSSREALSLSHSVASANAGRVTWPESVVCESSIGRSNATSSSRKSRLKGKDTQGCPRQVARSINSGIDSDVISRMSSLRMSLVNKNLQHVSFMKTVAVEEAGSEESEGGHSGDTDILSLPCTFRTQSSFR